MRNNNEITEMLKTGGTILVIGAIVTAPIWFPLIFNKKPKECECGTKISPFQVQPYCKCRY